MIDLSAIQTLVGPLPKCQHAEASMETRKVVVAGILRDALDEAYERLERVAEALPAHEWDDEWGVHYKVKLVPEPELKRAEAERDEARFFADGWHKQFRRVNAARHEEKARAEHVEAEARKWEQVAREYAKAKDSLDLTLNDILARYDAEHGGGA